MTSAVNAAYLSGDITGGTVYTAATPGTIVKLDPTVSAFTVGSDNFNTNNLYVFDEVQDFLLTSDLALDAGGGTIAAGTIVSSHYIVFDPASEQSVAANLLFDQQILGILRSDRSLTATNFLGATNVTYLDPVGVGLEAGLDFLTLPTDNKNALRLNFLQADTPGDAIRVITAAKVVTSAVPEPATWAMLVVGFGAVGAVMRRRSVAPLAVLA